ncbi:hypothetical protein VNO77_22208 [Canavalia gladiata]|uniref:Uncharacterized protein n=1 Tax=Canavalia gladiata TaxID=3824 RepID=A0AAN9QAK7_CANGL
MMKHHVPHSSTPQHPKLYRYFRVHASMICEQAWKRGQKHEIRNEKEGGKWDPSYLTRMHSINKRIQHLGRKKVSSFTAQLSTTISCAFNQ